MKRFPGAVSAHRWFVAAAAGCLIAFGWIVTGGTFQLDHPESFGDFFDHQAASLLEGRLDVPKEALGYEAFVIDGKYYGYFGVTPALLRMPLLGVGFGKWSRSFMLGFYALGLVAAYAALCHAVRLTTRGTGPRAWVAVLFTVNVGLGTTLFFLGSRAFVYHEAMLCGVAFALASGYGTLRHLAAPEGRWWIAALVCGLLSVHARPPVGLFALSLLACASLAVPARPWLNSAGPSVPVPPKRRWLAPLGMAALSGIGVLSYNGMSYLKFGSFEGVPLKHHVQYDQKRMADIENRHFHLSNLRYNFDTYVWRPNFALRPTFPYFYAQVRHPSEYPEARIDVVEQTLPLPYAMPAVCFLATLGVLSALGRGRATRLSILVLLGGVVPLAGAMLTAVAVTHRYTADFCPPLILAAAFGLAAVDGATGWPRQALRGIVFALTLCSILVTLAITLQYQGEGIWGVPDDVKQRYRELRQDVDRTLGVGRP